MTLDTLAAAEAAIDQLISRLDVPLKSEGACTLALGIARQTAIVYEALRREAVADPTGIVGQILLRQITEAAILVRWIEDSPDLRTEMYHADDDRRRLSADPIFVRWRAKRGGGSGPIFDVAQAAQMRSGIDAVRAKARAAGEPIKADGPLLPTLEIMATSTKDNAAFEAYQIIYRTASPFTHSGGRAVASHEIEDRADGKHLVIKGPYGGRALRSIAAPSMAMVIEATSRICELGLDAEARVWRDGVIRAPA